LFAPALHSWKYFKSEIEKVKKQFKDNQYVGSEKHDNTPRPYKPTYKKEPTYHNIGKLPFKKK
jgi:hypothetical protein